MEEEELDSINEYIEEMILEAESNNLSDFYDDLDNVITDIE